MDRLAVGGDRGARGGVVIAEVAHYAGPQLAALLHARGAKPWVALRLDADDPSELLPVPTGACVSVAGATGAGKSTLALQLAWVHALTTGPAIYVSLELDAEELAARIVAQRCGVSWMDALRGTVPFERMRDALDDLPRFRVLHRNGATLARLSALVGALRHEHPNQPILVTVDYVQIMPANDRDASLGGDPRMRVTQVVEEIRQTAKELDVLCLMISQVSREASGQLNSGNKSGSDTIAAGAESAQSERAAHATLALGAMVPEANGWTNVSLSIGKNRMGPGDRVIPLSFNGATGLFKLAGAPVAATKQRKENRASAVRDRVVEAVKTCEAGYRNVTALWKAVGGNKKATLAAARAELGEGGRLETRGKGAGQRISVREQFPVPVPQ